MIEAAGLPTVVVRPSGVWNTRAPLHVFFCRAGEIQRDYSLLTLAVARTRYEAEHLPTGTGQSAAKFMRARVAGPVASKAWNGYRDWWRQEHRKGDGQPSIGEVEQDLATTLYPIRELGVVKIASVFEMFVQCWALNMLLATLEAGIPLVLDQQKLVKDVSPVHTPKTPMPGVLRILKTFPGVMSDLGRLPHIRTDPATGTLLEEPTTPDLNSYRAILFWREFRNLAVHSAGLVSGGFCDRHGAFFDAMREPFQDKLRALKPMTKLQLPYVVFYAMVSVHYRAAIFLNERLQEASRRYRGTIYLPKEGVDEPSRFDPSLTTKPLLIDGDHPNSLRWCKEETFRSGLIAAITKA